LPKKDNLNSSGQTIYVQVTNQWVKRWLA